MLWFFTHIFIVPFCFFVLCSQIYFVLAISFLPRVYCCICNHETIYRPVARGVEGVGGPHISALGPGEPRSRCTIAPGFPRVVRVSQALYYSSRLPRALKHAVRARILWCTPARPCEGGVAWRCGPCWAKNDPPIMET